ncbi:hypothetical protein PN36_08000 [Candidatus Thiomargarita nelsonii]|uniref:Uncharacterized protein n=1 Tax=Candidatus Thiomargarita nelsonii TaxID=1003181 RepID=A0A4E0QRN5_9GAMM|nr:hypothetical protein PN36_08000 [Candidatus Thiomargarita nelsonii]
METTLNIEIDEEITFQLKTAAKRLGIKNIKNLAIQFIRQGIALSSAPTLPVYNDLDSLAGTWTEEEKAFLSTVSDFSQIEEALWH